MARAGMTAASAGRWPSVPGWRSLWRDVNAANVAAGVVSALLAMTGPVLLLLQAATAAGFTPRQTVSWVFAAYAAGGLFSIVMPLRYRIPVTGAHSLTGVAYLAGVASHFTFPQLVGGYVMSALLILLLGVTGVYARLLAWVPGPVVSAMLAGLIAPYVANLAVAARALPLIAACTFAGYLAAARWAGRVPPVAGAVVGGFAALVCTHGITLGHGSGWLWPHAQVPAFTLPGLYAVALPLALLILGNDITPGLGALTSFGFRPPVRSLVACSGIASLAASMFGGHCANVAGMMTAICADEAAGPPAARYVASMVSGLLLILFGLFAFVVVPFFSALPSAFLTLLAGCSLLGPFANSLRASFAEGSHLLASAVTFAIALSNVTVFHIGAAIWALAAGCLTARLLGPRP